MDWFISFLDSFIERYVIEEQRILARTGLRTVIEASVSIIKSRTDEDQLKESGIPGLQVRLGVLTKFLDILSMQSQWSAKAFSTVFLGLMMIYLKGEEYLKVYLAEFIRSDLLDFFERSEEESTTINELLAQQPRDEIKDFYNLVSQTPQILETEEDEDALRFLTLTEAKILQLIDFNITINIARLGNYCKEHIPAAAVISLMKESEPNPLYCNLIRHRFQRLKDAHLWKPEQSSLILDDSKLPCSLHPEWSPSS